MHLKNFNEWVRMVTRTDRTRQLGKATLRKALERAMKEAKVEDFTFHDFRHCAVTRWTLAGIPEDIRKLAAGHSRRSVHQRYVNPPDEQMG